MITYTTTDFKKYVYARGKFHIRRIEEIITALDGAHGFDPEDSNDLWYLFAEAVYYLWLAAFVDDHRQADAEKQRGTVWAQTHSAAMPDPEIERARTAADIYSDGRSVTTTYRFGERQDDYVTHVWHPDSLHPDNRPGAVIEFSQGPYPFRYRNLIVTAPGIIDTYQNGEEELLR